MSNCNNCLESLNYIEEFEPIDKISECNTYDCHNVNKWWDLVNIIMNNSKSKIDFNNVSHLSIEYAFKLLYSRMNNKIKDLESKLEDKETSILLLENKNNNLSGDIIILEGMLSETKDNMTLCLDQLENSIK